MDKPASPRDDNGRFGPGNAGGPGRPRGKGYELLQAAQEAVSPDAMRAMMRKALMMALGGNLNAMRFVAERTLGRPPEAPSEGVAIDLSLPRLRTAGDCAAAIDRVHEAISKGAIGHDTAKVMLDLILVRLKAIEATDLEERIQELEKAAKQVESRNT